MPVARIWEQKPKADRSLGGRPPAYDNPADLWTDAVDYFQWVEDNPLMEEKSVVVAGAIEKAHTAKARAMSISGLCVFLNIAQSTYRSYRERDGFSEVLEMIDDIMYSQKFEGASAGLMNANIIARELGLAERRDVDMKANVNVSHEDSLDLLR